MSVEYRPRCVVCGVAWVDHTADCPRHAYPHRAYLAGRYSRRLELCHYRQLLRDYGWSFHCRWLEGNHQIDDRGLSVEAEAGERTRYAVEDWEDLMSSNLCLNFTEAPRSDKTRGGRHVEYGAALARGIRCVVIGPRENVFHCLPRVEWFPDFDAFLDRWYPTTPTPGATDR